MSKKRIDKGLRGERAFADWLNNTGVGYVHVNQSKEMFAQFFKNSVKRPDFLILMDSVGILAIDVKNCKQLSNGDYSLKVTNELESVLNFERNFRLPVWYAFYDENDDTWYWISALKAFEIQSKKVNELTQEEFLSINRSEFIVIGENEDLGKLYTQRL